MELNVRILRAITVLTDELEARRLENNIYDFEFVRHVQVRESQWINHIDAACDVVLLDACLAGGDINKVMRLSPPNACIVLIGDASTLPDAFVIDLINQHRTADCILRPYDGARLAKMIENVKAFMEQNCLGNRNDR